MPNRRDARNAGQRSSMDYYEFKKQHELKKMREQRANAPKAPATQPDEEVEAVAKAAQPVSRPAKSEPAKPSAPVDEAEALDLDSSDDSKQTRRVYPKAVDADDDDEDDYEDDDEDEDGEEIQNPFAGVGSIFKGIASKTRSLFGRDDAEYDEDVDDIDEEEDEDEEDDAENESFIARGLRFIGINRKGQDDEEEDEDDEDEAVLPFPSRPAEPAKDEQPDDADPADEFSAFDDDVIPSGTIADKAPPAGDVEDIPEDIPTVKAPIAKDVGSAKGAEDSPDTQVADDADDRMGGLTFDRPMSDVDPVFTLDIEDYPEPQDDDGEEYDEDEEEDDEGESILDRISAAFASLRGRFSRRDDSDDYDDEDDDYDDEDDEYDDEGDDFMADDKLRKATSLTDLMAEGMEDSSAPTLSRRERKALEAQKGVGEAKLADLDDENAVDEPTQQFTPLRSRPVARPTKAAKHKITREDEDDEDEDDEDDLPVRRKPARPSRRVYGDDEDDEDDYDDDYDEYDDEYDDYDDYDDDYDDDFDDDREGGIGRGLIGFFKALLAVVLILALVILGLRTLESMSILSLDGLRNTVGQVIPLDALFPTPRPGADQIEGTDPAQGEATPDPTQPALPDEGDAGADEWSDPVDGGEEPNIGDDTTA